MRPSAFLSLVSVRFPYCAADVPGSGGSQTGPAPWIRFLWKATDPVFPGSPGEFSSRPARREEKRDVLEVLLRSFSMDAAWNDSYLRMEQYLTAEVERLFQSTEPLCLLLQKGNRPVAASLLDPDPEAVNHLVSGPAVTMEYRNRGLGSLMMEESLRALEKAGLGDIRGVTRDRTISAKHIYPKFGSVREVYRFPGETT